MQAKLQAVFSCTPEYCAYIINHRSARHRCLPYSRSSTALLRWFLGWFTVSNRIWIGANCGSRFCQCAGHWNQHRIAGYTPEPVMHATLCCTNLLPPLAPPACLAAGAHAGSVGGIQTTQANKAFGIVSACAAKCRCLVGPASASTAPAGRTPGPRFSTSALRLVSLCCLVQNSQTRCSSQLLTCRRARPPPAARPAAQRAGQHRLLLQLQLDPAGGKGGRFCKQACFTVLSCTDAMCHLQMTTPFPSARLAAQPPPPARLPPLPPQIQDTMKQPPSAVVQMRKAVNVSVTGVSLGGTGAAGCGDAGRRGRRGRASWRAAHLKCIHTLCLAAFMLAGVLLLP